MVQLKYLLIKSERISWRLGIAVIDTLRAVEAGSVKACGSFLRRRTVGSGEADGDFDCRHQHATAENSSSTKRHRIPPYRPTSFRSAVTTATETWRRLLSLTGLCRGLFQPRSENCGIFHGRKRKIAKLA